MSWVYFYNQSARKDVSKSEIPTVNRRSDKKPKSAKPDKPKTSKKPDTQPKYDKSYGIFLGTNPEDFGNIKGYKVVVLDAEYFSKSQIKQILKRNQKVYSYLNVGALEKFRKVYPRFKQKTLGEYKEWNELWMDVSDKGWQHYITAQARVLADKGVDGFFIDNLDVYYHYQKPEIYNGIVKILDQISSLKKQVMINGGDVFVQRMIKNGDLRGKVHGIFQETVFTSINFENETYGRQNPEDKKYFQNYVERSSRYGLKVVLIEYGASRQLAQEIKLYCTQHGFDYYLAPDLKLDQTK